MIIKYHKTITIYHGILQTGMTKREKLHENTKCVHDSIHGFIALSYFAVKMIDNKCFQRLRNIKQLGTCYYVFPTATHSRFEHSIGTYHVASKILNTIIETNPEDIDEYLSTIPELKEYYNSEYSGEMHILDNYVCELIKIAALCHDIGHGPFSHVFDDSFIKNTDVKNKFGATHEERSGILIEYIIKNDVDLKEIISDNEIQFIKNLINSSDSHVGFIYQIISNSVTGLDVDKYDYLLRDVYMLNFQAKIDISRLVNDVKIINNNIVYPEQAVDDIYNLLQTRYRLHQNVYCHKVVISTQLIISKILSLLDNILKISQSVLQVEKFITLTDEYIFNSVTILENFVTDETDKNTLGKIKKYVDMLNKRELYSIVYTITFKDLNIDEINDFLDDIDRSDESIIVHKGKIGFVSGNKPNPFDNIYVYKTKDSTKMMSMKENKEKVKLSAFKKNKEDILILPTQYQERYAIVYCSDKHDEQKIMKIRNDIKQRLLTL